jgi:hypothetical protein
VRTRTSVNEQVKAIVLLDKSNGLARTSNCPKAVLQVTTLSQNRTKIYHR